MAAAALESLEHALTIDWRHAWAVVVDGHCGPDD